MMKIYPKISTLVLVDENSNFSEDFNLTNSFVNSKTSKQNLLHTAYEDCHNSQINKLQITQNDKVMNNSSDAYLKCANKINKDQCINLPPLRRLTESSQNSSLEQSSIKPPFHSIQKFKEKLALIDSSKLKAIKTMKKISHLRCSSMISEKHSPLQNLDMKSPQVEKSNKAELSCLPYLENKNKKYCMNSSKCCPDLDNSRILAQDFISKHGSLAMKELNFD